MIVSLIHSDLGLLALAGEGQLDLERGGDVATRGVKGFVAPLGSTVWFRLLAQHPERSEPRPEGEG